MEDRVVCGICGIIRENPAELGPLVLRMTRAQEHRGPDGRGYFVEGGGAPFSDEQSPRLGQPSICSLGHSRLAIIDPDGGFQPMADGQGNEVAVFNGEIYNFRELRDELRAKGRPFVTDCDTEVLLQLYGDNPDRPAEWLGRLNGIFSIALWDRARRRLLLARDPFGVKPLHVCADRGMFFFSSEIKGILAAGVEARLNPAALHAFMNVRYVPGNDTLFDGIRRFPPAHYAWVTEGNMAEPVRYYELPREGRLPRGTPRADVMEMVRDGFNGAVERQLLSDVPLGVTLSGGLDSSMVVAAVDRAYKGSETIRTADRVLRTFTLGLNEPTDEIGDARAIAGAYATEHHEERLSLDPLRDMAEVIRAVEEPKINILQGYALARAVKEHVKVVLSGLGGDELFAGYDIHRYCNTLGRGHGIVPRGLSDALFRPVSRALWALSDRSRGRKNDLYRIGAQIALSVGDRAQFYCRLRNAWDWDAPMYDRLYAVPDKFRSCPPTRTYFDTYFDDGEEYLEQVLRAEFSTKMRNDFLVNEDRITSAHGVEGRVPFLDRELVEMAFRVPARWKMRGIETKALWKDSVCGQLPDRIVRKKKQGFTFSSYHQWLKDLRPAVETELTEEWCRETGIFNYEFVRRILDASPHPNLRWHYFMVWMMLGVKVWMKVFSVRGER